ncbi:MAG: hypothetical protein ACO2OX_01745 [Candidatus Nanopusillus sp.]
MQDLLNQIKQKIIILFKSFNSLYFFFDRFFTASGDINITYPKLIGNSDDLVGWSEGTKTVPSLKKLIQDSLRQYPYNIITPRLEKVSKGYVQMQIYFLNASFDKTRSIIPYTYSSRKYFVFENVDNVHFVKLYGSNDYVNKVIPLFIPHRVHENNLRFPLIKTIFSINPHEITHTGGINYAFLFMDDIYPATIIHDINLVYHDFSETSPGNVAIIDNPIIYFDQDARKTFIFKNYINSLIDCDMSNEDNFLKLTTPDISVNKYIKDSFSVNSFLYKKEYLLRDIELGFRKTFFPIQYEQSNTYYGITSIIKSNNINNTSFYYELYSPILLINNKKNIEYTKSKINIHELHLTKVNLIVYRQEGTFTHYESPLSFRYIPIIFPFIHDGTNIVKKIGYPVENSVEYVSSLQSWKSNYDDNNGKINFISKIWTTHVTGSHYYISEIRKDTSSIKVIYGILMIVNSIPILYAPYLKQRPDGYFYNVIYNPNDINMVKQRIRYEETELFPVFYNGYKLLNDQEYTLYGKRYPYNKSFFSFAPFFGYEYNYNGKKYLVPILLRYAGSSNESNFKDWNAGFFTLNAVKNWHDFPNENMMFSVFNLNKVSNLEANNSGINLAYRLLGTLVLLVNGDDWTHGELSSLELPVPAIRGYVEFYKNAATPILEKIDDGI